MTSVYQRKSFKERWRKLSFAEQIGHIGSEFSRAEHWEKAGDFENRQKALERAIELIDLTIEANRACGHARLAELLRLREVICDFFSKKEIYNIKTKNLTDYFLFFALATRK